MALKCLYAVVTLDLRCVDMRAYLANWARNEYGHLFVFVISRSHTHVVS